MLDLFTLAWPGTVAVGSFRDFEVRPEQRRITITSLHSLVDLISLTDIVVAAATARVRAVAVVHSAGGQPGGALVAAGGYVLQTHETPISQHLKIEEYRVGAG